MLSFVDFLSFLAFARIARATLTGTDLMQSGQLSFNGDPIGYMRVDPIVSPGNQKSSSHTHVLFGANNVNSASTSDSLRQAKCTTLQIANHADMSSYWAIPVMQVDAFGRYNLMPVQGETMYYNLATTTSVVQPFPDDFSLVTGNATNFNGNGPTMNGYFFSDFGNTASLPTSYTSLLGTHLTFQDCWDGIPFTSSTQNQHMKFSDSTTYDCDPGWTKLPQIMLSITYSTGLPGALPANPSGPMYVLPNGDEKGSTLHGDFMNGWNTTVLQQVVTECNNLGHGNSKLCKAVTISSADASACTYDGQIPDEDVGLVNPITSFPGCNNLGGGSSPGCDTSVSFVDPPFWDHSLQHSAGLPYVNGTSNTSPLPVPVPFVASFRYSGCYIDTSDRVLNTTWTSSLSMTLETCAKTCASFNYFGLEFGHQCFCGDELTSAGKVDPNAANCNMACPNTNDLCGGTWRLSLYENFPAAPEQVGDYQYQGCWYDSPTRALNITWTSTTKMTTELCESICAPKTWFGTEGNQCFCTDTLLVTGAQDVKPNECNIPCPGNNSEICGGTYKISVYKRV